VAKAAPVARVAKANGEHVDGTSLLQAERNLLSRIARGGALDDVLRDLILLAEEPSKGEMLASILFVSRDGTQLLDGAAPSLPAAYNAAIHGLAIGPNVGSCGTAAHRGEPVFVTDIMSDPLWAAFRDLAASHGLRACWSVPIRDANGNVLGTFANYYREPRQPTPRDIEAIQLLAQTASIAIERHRSEIERERAAEQQRLFLEEMQHRTRNLVAVIEGIARQSRPRNEPVVDAYIDALMGRLRALFSGSELVFASDARRTTVSEIARLALAPFMTENARISIEATPIALSERTAAGLSLAFHELATNAIKYGALKTPGGKVTVTCGAEPKDESARVSIEWKESGGEVLRSIPERRGFGSRVIEAAVSGERDAKVERLFEPTGLRCRFEFTAPFGGMNS